MKVTKKPLRITKAAAIDIWKSQCAAASRESYRLDVDELTKVLSQLNELTECSPSDPLGLFLGKSVLKRVKKRKKVHGVSSRKCRSFLRRMERQSFVVNGSKFTSISDISTSASIDELIEILLIELLRQRQLERTSSKGRAKHP